MARSDQMPATLARPAKRSAGRTQRATTPLHVRFHRLDASEALIARIRDRASRKLGRFAFHVTRITVRLEDANAAKGGVDKLCSIKLTLPSAPTIVVQERAADAYEAFDRALGVAERALRRSLERRERGVPKGWSEDQPDVGQPARDAKPRKKSNAKRRARRAVAALETSEGARPSRKSTRKSSNRGKQDDELRRRQTMRTRSSKAKATRARAKRT